LLIIKNLPRMKAPPSLYPVVTSKLLENEVMFTYLRLFIDCIDWL